MALTNATTLADYSSGIGTQGATLKVDANNQRVGIGTLTPAETLDVVGNMAVDGDISVTGTISYEDLTNVDSIGIITARSGIDIKGGIGATFADNVKAFFGTGGDLEIYHDGTNNRITSNTTNTYIQTNGVTHFTNVGNSEKHLIINDDGSVQLYYDNVATFETISNGVKVRGGEGGQGILELSSDEGDDNSDKFRLVVNDAGPLFIQNFASGTWETNIKILGNGSVELYNDNSKKFETTSSGVTVTGTLNSTTDVQINGKSAATTGKAIAMALIFG